MSVTLLRNIGISFCIYRNQRVFGYSAAEIAAVDPKDAIMMELSFQFIDDEPEVHSIIEQAFAAKEDESNFLKRIKNSPRKIVEGGV